MTMQQLPDRRFRPEPMTAAEAIAWIQSHGYVWYQAPMDHSPTRVHLTSKLKTWKRAPERFSVSAELSQHNERFTIDNAHLDRLRMPNALWHHGISAVLHHERYAGRPRPAMVLSQSNGFHLEMRSLRHAKAFAQRSAIELTVRKWIHGKLYRRVLVAAREPVSGERMF